MSMTANLQIAPQVPSEFTPAVPMTSSDFVVSRRMREYIADSQTEFKYDGNNVIKFTLNSADAFLDGRNSWLQFTLQAPAAAATNLTVQEATSRFLESGGAHSLFSRLRISLSNGTIISDYDYSQLYATVRQHTMSAQHLNFQEGFSSYDSLHSSVNDGVKLPSKSFESLANPGAASYTAAGRIVGGLAGTATTMRIGDEVIITVTSQPAAAATTASQTIVGRIATIPDANSFTLEAGNVANEQDIPAAGAKVTGIFKVNGERTHRFRGAVGVDDATAVLCKIKLFSDFFNNIKYLPLPFLRNLTIELTLNRGLHSVVFAKNSAALGGSFNWIIKNPVIMANLVTPSESLINAYVEQYNSEQGIMLHWIDYQSNKIGSSNAVQNENLRIPSNCHSALAVIVAQKPSEAQAVIAGTTWYNDTNGNSLKMSITSYQFQVGSEYFPFARPVDTSGVSNGNAWNHVLGALDSHGAKYECSSIVPTEYYSVNSYVRQAGVIANESLRFYMATRLDRDGNYTGIDTSNNDIQLNITRSGAKDAGFDGSYYHCFIIHNRLIRISKASTIVFS